MPDLLQPDSMTATIADLNRRLQILEATSRTGLSGVRTAWGTAAASPTVFGADELGPASATWTADDASTGTGYPKITITNMPARAMLLWSARPTSVADAAAYRSNGVIIYIAINGIGGGLAFPSTARATGNTNTNPVDVAMMGSAVKKFVAGQTYTFQLCAN